MEPKLSDVIQNIDIQEAVRSAEKALSTETEDVFKSAEIEATPIMKEVTDETHTQESEEALIKETDDEVASNKTADVESPQKSKEIAIESPRQEATQESNKESEVSELTPIKSEESDILHKPQEVTIETFTQVSTQDVTMEPKVSEVIQNIDIQEAVRSAEKVLITETEDVIKSAEIEPTPIMKEVTNETHTQGADKVYEVQDIVKPAEEGLVTKTEDATTSVKSQEKEVSQISKEITLETSAHVSPQDMTAVSKVSEISHSTDIQEADKSMKEIYFTDVHDSGLMKSHEAPDTTEEVSNETFTQVTSPEFGTESKVSEISQSISIQESKSAEGIQVTEAEEMAQMSKEQSMETHAQDPIQELTKDTEFTEISESIQEAAKSEAEGFVTDTEKVTTSGSQITEEVISQTRTECMEQEWTAESKMSKVSQSIPIQEDAKSADVKATTEETTAVILEETCTVVETSAEKSVDHTKQHLEELGIEDILEMPMSESTSYKDLDESFSIDASEAIREAPSQEEKASLRLSPQPAETKLQIEIAAKEDPPKGTKMVEEMSLQLEVEPEVSSLQMYMAPEIIETPDERVISETEDLVHEQLQQTPDSTKAAQEAGEIDDELPSEGLRKAIHLSMEITQEEQAAYTPSPEPTSVDISSGSKVTYEDSKDDELYAPELAIGKATELENILEEDKETETTEKTETTQMETTVEFSITSIEKDIQSLKVSSDLQAARQELHRYEGQTEPELIEQADAERHVEFKEVDEEIKGRTEGISPDALWICEEGKSESIDEMLVVCMPPGGEQAHVTVSQEDMEGTVAPSIQQTMSFEEATDSQDISLELKDDSELDSARDQIATITELMIQTSDVKADEASLEVDTSESRTEKSFEEEALQIGDLVAPAIAASSLHSMQFLEEKDAKHTNEDSEQPKTPERAISPKDELDTSMELNGKITCEEADMKEHTTDEVPTLCQMASMLAHGELVSPYEEEEEDKESSLASEQSVVENKSEVTARVTIEDKDENVPTLCQMASMLVHKQAVECTTEDRTPESKTPVELKFAQQIEVEEPVEEVLQIVTTISDVLEDVPPQVDVQVEELVEEEVDDFIAVDIKTGETESCEKDTTDQLSPEPEEFEMVQQQIDGQDVAIFVDFRLLESFRSHYVQDHSMEPDEIQLQTGETDFELVEASDIPKDYITTHETMSSSAEFSDGMSFDSLKKKSDSVDELEQEESGLEVTMRDYRSFDESYLDQGTDTIISERTDSLLQASTCSIERTLSDRTLEADLGSSNTLSDAGTETESPLKRRKEQLTILAKNVIAETQVEVLMSQVSQVAKDIKAEVKELNPDLTPTPDSKEMPTPLLEMTSMLETHEEEEYLTVETEEQKTDGVKTQRIDEVSCASTEEEVKTQMSIDLEKNVKGDHEQQVLEEEHAIQLEEYRPESVDQFSMSSQEHGSIDSQAHEQPMSHVSSMESPRHESHGSSDHTSSDAVGISKSSHASSHVEEFYGSSVGSHVSKSSSCHAEEIYGSSVGSHVSHVSRSSHSEESSDSHPSRSSGESYLSSDVHTSKSSSHSEYTESSYTSSDLRMTKSSIQEESSEMSESSKVTSAQSGVASSSASGYEKSVSSLSYKTGSSARSHSGMSSESHKSETDEEQVSPRPSSDDRSSPDQHASPSLSPPNKSPTSQLKASSPEESHQSLPSSPRRLRRAISNGVKKMTSELFSTESDISRSLEIIYIQPDEDARRKLSERYRHSSSSGNSVGSLDGQKLEKKKASVTNIRKSAEIHEHETMERTSESSSISYELQKSQSAKDFEPYVTPMSPPSGKKTPSPTKVRQPPRVSSDPKVSEDVISPVLEVECRTPERSPRNLTEYVSDDAKDQLQGEALIEQVDQGDFIQPQSQSPVQITSKTMSISQSSTEASCVVEEDASYADKKKFWERMPSTDSSCSEQSVTRQSHSVQQHLGEIGEEDLEKRSNMSADSSTEAIMASSGTVLTTSSSSDTSYKGEQKDSVKQSGPKSAGLRLTGPFSVELSDSEIQQQITPEKKEHFETFVRPSLTEETSEDEQANLEHKAIPLVKQDSNIDKEMLITRQIKDDLVDKQLDEQEESLMSARSLQDSMAKQPETEHDVPAERKGSKTDFVTRIEAIEAEFDNAASILGQPLVQDIPEEQHIEALSSFDAQIPKKERKDDVQIRELNKNVSIVIHDAPKEMEETNMTEGQALELALGLVDEISVQAVKKVKEVSHKEEDDQPQDEASPKHKTPEEEAEQKYEKAKKLAEELVGTINVQAVHIAEQVSPRSRPISDIHFIGLQQQNGNVTEDQRQMRLMTEFSADISDEDMAYHYDQRELDAEFEHYNQDIQCSFAEVKQSLTAAQEAIKGTIQKDPSDTQFQFVEEVQVTERHSFNFTSSFVTHFVTAINPENQEHAREVVVERHLQIAESTETGPSKSTTTSTSHTTISSSQTHSSTFSSQSPSGGTTQDSGDDIWAEESKIILRRDLRKKADGYDSSSSASRTPRDQNRMSGAFSGTSGTDDYFSAHEQPPSRPSSSDMDAMLSARSGKSSTMTTTTEYETAHSSREVFTSQDYVTAASSFSSKSVDTSESSGHLASFEASEASETLMDIPASEFDREFAITPTGAPHEEEVASIHPSGSQLLQESDEETSDVSSTSPAPHMVRSAEMIFQPEPHAVVEEDVRQLLESRETLSASILTISSASEATVVQREIDIEAELESEEAQAKKEELYFQIESEVQDLKEEMSKSNLSNLTESTSSTSSSGRAVQSITPQTGSGFMSSLEEFKKDESPGKEELPVPRNKSFDDTSARVSFDVPDSSDDFSSRPESELDDFRSRPQSTSGFSLSRSSSEDQRPMYKHEMSVPELTLLNVADEPFARPVTPEPPRDVGAVRDAAEAEEELSEAEIAFSKHFTEVVEETFEKHESLGIVPEVTILQAVEPEKELEQLKMADVKVESSVEEQVDDLIIGSPPIINRPLGVKYWPPSDELHLEDDGTAPMEKTVFDEFSEVKVAEEKDVEEGRKWLESQFEGGEATAVEGDENYPFCYSQPLDQIIEEDERESSEDFNDLKDLEKFKESLSSTPDFEMIAHKKGIFNFKNDKDDVSMSSLSEFERLEQEIGLNSGSGSRASLGSQDSLEATATSALPHSSNNGKSSSLPRKLFSKSGTGDDVSVDSAASLKEFEQMEFACKEAENIEKIAKEQEDVLSEIEEGHESQISESESCETLSEAGKSDGSEDFEQRMFQIDEIIKQAQSNVEKFDSDLEQSMLTSTEMLPLKDIMGDENKTPSVHSEEEDSLEAEVNRFKQKSSPPRPDLMQASADSLELLKTMETSTDSLENGRSKKATQDLMTISTDSIEKEQALKRMTQSVDSLEGNGKDNTLETSSSSVHDLPKDHAGLITSTDSLESCSNNTRATASMLSSLDSATSDTLIAELEDDNRVQEMTEAKRLLLQQGEIQLEDSDDSLSCPQTTTSVHVSHYKGTQGPRASEVVKQADEIGYQYIIERTVQMPADITKIEFKGPDADAKMKEYMEQFEAGEHIHEHRTVDDKGNIMVKKVVERRMIVQDAKSTIPFESKEMEQKLREMSEKMDESCEEVYLESDEFGNERKYVVKRSIEPLSLPQQSDVVCERRQQQGLSPMGKVELYRAEFSAPISLNPVPLSLDSKAAPKSSGGSQADADISHKGVDDVIQKQHPTGHEDTESNA